MSWDFFKVYVPGSSYAGLDAHRSLDQACWRVMNNRRLLENLRIYPSAKGWLTSYVLRLIQVREREATSFLCRKTKLE